MLRDIPEIIGGIVQKPREKHSCKMMAALEKHHILPMPPKDEKSQCREFVEDIFENDTIHPAVLEAYRSVKVKMDETVPGIKEFLRWQNNTVVRHI